MAQPQQKSIDPGSSLTKWDIMAGVIPLLASIPMLVPYTRMILDRPSMWFALVVWCSVSVWLSLTFWKNGSETTRTRAGWGLLSYTASCLVYCLAVWYYSPLAAAAACTACFIGWGLLCWRSQTTSVIMLAGALLASTLIWPRGLSDWYQFWLEHSSAELVSSSFDWFRVPNLLQEAQFATPSFEIELGTVSAFASVFALFACAIGLALILRRSLLHLILLMLSCPFWFVLGCYALLLAQWYCSGPDTALPIGVLQGLALVGMLICLGCTDLFLLSMLRPVPLTDPTLGITFHLANTLLNWPRQLDEPETIDSDEYEDEDASVQATRAEHVPYDQHFEWQRHSTFQYSVLLLCVLWLASAVAPTWLLVKNALASASQPTIPIEVLNALTSCSQPSDQLEDWLVVSSPSKSVNELPATFEWSFRWRNATVSAHVTFPHSSPRPNVMPKSAVDEPTRMRHTKEHHSVDEWDIFVDWFVDQDETVSYCISSSLSADIKKFFDDSQTDPEHRRSIYARLVDQQISTGPSLWIVAECKRESELSERELDELTKSFHAFREVIYQALNE